MPDFFVSSATAADHRCRTVISIVYLRYMWRALAQASDTLDDPDDGRPDAFTYSFAGAVVAVIASSLPSRSMAWPRSSSISALCSHWLSPIAVAYTFYRELRLDFEALRRRTELFGYAFSYANRQRSEAHEQEEGASAWLHPARRQQPRDRHVAPPEGQDQLGLDAGPPTGSIMARTMERGLFDAMFIADELAPYNNYEGSSDATVK